jgi:hypothetical protein
MFIATSSQALGIGDGPKEAQVAFCQKEKVQSIGEKVSSEK